MTTNKTYPLRSVGGPYGAPMGRRDSLPDDADEPVRLSLVRLVMVDGAYDTGGAYWGGWTPSGGGMYRAVGNASETVVELFVRARTRDEAKAVIRQKLPAATFYR